jgi:tyrosine-protein kinase Etk/Wzc
VDIKEDINTDEINLLDYLIVVAKRKRLILSITLSAAIITAIISFILPPVYRAETKILPPQQSSSSLAADFLSQLGGAAGVVSAATNIKTPNDLYIELLQSRSVLDRIIDRFNLMSLYKIESREKVRSTLMDRFEVQNGRKSNIITLTVDDEDPKRAAGMANAFVDELMNLTKGLAVTEAAQRRLFFEEQLKGTKIALTKAEENLRGFQEKSGAVQVESQAKAVIESVANIRAQIAAREVQLKVMRTYATAQNPDLQKIEEELRGLNEQLLRLEEKGGRNPDPLMPIGRMPKVGTEYIRKLRDLKFNETLYELLTKQYEAAKLDEAREAVVIQVIDKALPPEKKTKPQRALMVITATLTGLFFSVLAAFFMEYMENSSKNPENKKRYETLKDTLKAENFFKRDEKN